MVVIGAIRMPERLPISAAAFETAIKQAGVGVDMSLLAFKWGRMAVVDIDYVHAEIHKYEAKAPKLRVKKIANIASGSKEANKIKVAKITKAQITRPARRQRRAERCSLMLAITSFSSTSRSHPAEDEAAAPALPADEAEAACAHKSAPGAAG